MHRSYKDGLPTDAVHVDTSPRLQIVQMNIAKLGDQVDHIMFGTHLKSKNKMLKKQ